MKFKRSNDTKIIGVTGAAKKSGCTHTALVLANKLRKLGYKVALLEENDSGAFEQIAEEYECRVNSDECFNYQGIDYYIHRHPRRLPVIMQKGYHYIIVDHGEYSECDKDFLGTNHRQIIVCGSRPWEINEMNNIFDDNEDEAVLKTYHYCFIFASANKSLQKVIKDNMGALKNVYFPPYSENPFKNDDFPFVDKILGIRIDKKQMESQSESISEEIPVSVSTSAIEIPHSTSTVHSMVAEHVVAQPVVVTQNVVAPKKKSGFIINLLKGNNQSKSPAQSSTKSSESATFISQSEVPCSHESLNSDSVYEIEHQTDAEQLASLESLRDIKSPEMTENSLQEPKEESIIEDEYSEADFVENTSSEIILSEEDFEPAEECVVEQTAEDIVSSTEEIITTIPEETKGNEDNLIEDSKTISNTEEEQPEAEKSVLEVYMQPKSEQLALSAFLVMKENSKCKDFSAMHGLIDAKSNVLINSLLKKQMYCTIGSLLRAGVVHTRENGPDGTAAIKISSEQCQYVANEQGLRELLEADAEYLIFPEQDNYVEL